jgi:hypothetical protein
MKTNKPIVKCARVSFYTPEGSLYEVALLDRLSDHPRLGPPRTESQTRTSYIVEKNLNEKWIETRNTIYVWED